MNKEIAGLEPPLRKDAYLQSLENGLAVLAAFTAAQPFLSIADVALKTRQDRASARRALLTLAHLGYLRHSGKRFSLTARVLNFGYQYLSALPFWSVAQPVMEELSDQLNETVSIGVLDGHDVVFLLRVPAKRLLSFDPSIGSRVPAHLHSIGHVLLATLSASALEDFVRAIDFAPRTSYSLSDPGILHAQLEATRTSGWSMTARQYEEGYGGISVPLTDSDGNVLAGLNVSFIMDSDAGRRATEDILPRLKLAMRKIQESAG
ncbi:MAG: pcaR [Herbaspirillum sp.]|nr:pcaR [Herbaspirillum sp.]